MRFFPTRRLFAGVVFATALSPMCSMSAEDVRPARLSDASVPDYVLQDPLQAADGTRVTTAATWEAKRRPELLELFTREIYGRTPLGRPVEQQAEVVLQDPAALGGLATRKEIAVWFTRDRTGPSMRVLLYVPNAVSRKPCPLFLGLNFYGNHTATDDPGVALAEGWVPSSPGAVDHRATEAARGVDVAKWQIPLVLARGYATATLYSGDLCPDHRDGLAEGVNGWFAQTTTESRADDAWGAIGVWAWGLSRALDVLATDPDIDATHVAVHGHSRMGKAALWAGARDARFALVISNESGCGGAALSKRIHGETVARINTSFPHWFAKNFRRYNDAEPTLPVDQHQLLALIAPRALHVASAEDDDWADPRGEFLSVVHAEPVYALFARKGPGRADVPSVHDPAGETLRYHIRSGPHDMTAYDWSAYLDTADRVLR